MSFLAKVNTTTDVENLVSNIDSLKESLFVLNSPASNVPEVLKADFEAAGDKSAFLDEVRDKLLKARVLNLTIASDLPQSIVQNISLWVKNNVGEDVILGLSVNPGILAGATVTFSGRFKDYSYKEDLVKAVENIRI